MISEHASPLATQGGVDSGGQNVYVAYLARELARCGHSVDVFTRRDSPDLPRVVQCARNLRVIHVRGGPEQAIPKEALLPWMTEFSEEVLGWCRAQAEPYDVVHANFFMSGLAALRLRDELGLPFVITFHALGKVRRAHQGKADAFPEARLDIEQQLVRQADRIIAECPQDRQDLITHYAADPARIDVVPCGVNIAELGFGDGLSRDRLGLPEDAFVILQLGRLVPRKGIDNVILALSHLRHQLGIDATLLVVGGESALPDPVRTPEIARLGAIAASASVADRVIFTGRRARADLRDYYCAANVFVTTPWYEPFGITPLEAMACARPVIGAAVGGITHTVVNNVTGYLVPPRDPIALADRLARLHADPVRAQAFGHAGLQRVRRLFTWKKVAEALIPVYGAVCASPAADTLDAARMKAASV
ncbi:glycosyltransferase [Uliginosibacterium paludis]|uniref:Glycosyltransferase n=1 Tax=Uliginosibacterium paludis TaxID=1615952 RepID=A0ABV2CT17_9RHOO